ncbi:MAG: hypothetical protein HY863_15080 [Chloroflexi bacterium]|nr:hypothetical protein [Chloroflexota bacterium]
MSDRNRRIYGIVIGLVFGLPFAIISEFINSWMLPGIPLFELPMGRVTTVVLTILFMIVLGLIIAWEEESFWGVLGGSMFIVLLSSVQAYINSGVSEGVTSFFLFLFTFLPRLVIYLPLAFFFRWVLGNFDRAASISSGRKGSPFLALTVLVALAVIGGRFSILAPEARQALQDGNALVLEGISAVENGTDLPNPLIDVDGFSTHAKGSYTLEWSSDVDQLPVTRPMSAFGTTESLIIFHFENKYLFGCAYTPPSRVPKCINITRVR